MKPLIKRAAPFVATIVASAIIGQAAQSPSTSSAPTPTQIIESTTYPTQTPPTPQPTYTPYPTATIYPTATLYPTAKPVTQYMQTQEIASEQPATGGGFSCNCSKTCGSMSCQEAYFQLNQCGCSARDSDNDGIPCESQCR